MYTIPGIDREYRTVPISEISNLNPQQVEVVNSPLPLIVVAGPGSGKTETVTQKISKQFIRHIGDLSRSLILTFTNAAASEILERIGKSLNMNINKAKYYTGTFHGVFLKLIKENPDITKGLVSSHGMIAVLDANDNSSFIKSALIDIYCKSNPSVKKPTFQVIKDWYEVDIDYFMKRISSVANFPHNSIQDYYDEIIDYYIGKPGKINKLKEVLKLYHHLKFTQSVISFGDILLYTYLALKNNEYIREKVKNQFDQIVVDEYQDTNPIQSACIDLIHRNNYCKIGDPYQSIYRFMGAELQNIMKEVKNPDINKVQLITNYRSTENIVSITNKVMKSFTENVGSIPCTSGNTKFENKSIHVVQAREEDKFIVEKIKQNVKKGIPLHDQAALIRSRITSIMLEKSLHLNSIPFIKLGGASFYDQAEIKPLLSLTKLLIKSGNMIDFKKVSSLFPGVGESSIDRIVSEFITNHGTISILEIIDNLYPKNLKIKNMAKILYDDSLIKVDVVDKILEIITFTDYYEGIVKKSTAKSENEKLHKLELVKENVGILLNQIKEIEKSGALALFLENVTLDKGQLKDIKDKFIISTMHSSKGLEWRVCYIMGCSSGEFPKIDEQNDKDYEEEKRLFYVSVSRAKEELYITASGDFSSFVKEVYEEPYINLYKVGDFSGFSMNVWN